MNGTNFDHGLKGLVTCAHHVTRMSHPASQFSARRRFSRHGDQDPRLFSPSLRRHLLRHPTHTPTASVSEPVRAGRHASRVHVGRSEVVSLPHSIKHRSHGRSQKQARLNSHVCPTRRPGLRLSFRFYFFSASLFRRFPSDIGNRRPRTRVCRLWGPTAKGSGEGGGSAFEACTRFGRRRRLCADAVSGVACSEISSRPLTRHADRIVQGLVAFEARDRASCGCASAEPWLDALATSGSSSPESSRDGRSRSHNNGWLAVDDRMGSSPSYLCCPIVRDRRAGTHILQARAATARSTSSRSAPTTTTAIAGVCGLDWRAAESGRGNGARIAGAPKPCCFSAQRRKGGCGAGTRRDHQPQVAVCSGACHPGTKAPRRQPPDRRVAFRKGHRHADP